ncbi:MAG: hypothetical protein HS110_12000 [Zoogloeaceae bacterium]|nr:hypothetical protein [Zoogloeaceae bacterium]
MSDGAHERSERKLSDRFIKICWFRSPGLPEGKGFIVYQDKAGFFYLRKLVEREGLATPFSSIQELEMALEMQLELVREKALPGGIEEGGDK